MDDSGRDEVKERQANSLHHYSRKIHSWLDWQGLLVYLSAQTEEAAGFLRGDSTVRAQRQNGHHHPASLVPPLFLAILLSKPDL